MTRVLVTTIHRGCSVDEASGFLYVVDLDEGGVESRCPMVEAPLRERDPNPRGGMRGGRGIAVSGDEVYVANFSNVFRFDSAWKLVNTISHPGCADIHDIAWLGDALWVTSTRNDHIFRFASDGSLLDRWNAGGREVLGDSLGLSGPKPADDRDFDVVDFRDPRSHEKSLFDCAHVNALETTADGTLLVSLGQVVLRDRSVSAILQLDVRGHARLPLVLDEATVPCHNLQAMPSGDVLMNDTARGDLVRFDPRTGQILSRTRLDSGYLRGLLRLHDGRLVIGAQRDLIVLDPNGAAPRLTIRLSDNARESVHSIETLPESIAALPEALSVG